MTHLFGAPLNTAVLAGHVLTVPVVGSPTGEAEVGVALSDGQVARTLLGVALRFAAASGKAVLTFRERFFIILTVKSLHHGACLASPVLNKPLVRSREPPSNLQPSPQVRKRRGTAVYQLPVRLHYNYSHCPQATAPLFRRLNLPEISGAPKVSG